MTKTKTAKIQDRFLARARRGECPVTLFLMNGFQMRGTIAAFDSFTVVLQSEGRQNLIYKHAISTVCPIHPLDISDWEGEEAD